MLCGIDKGAGIGYPSGDNGKGVAVDLDIDIRGRGRAAQPADVEIVRALNAADIAMLETERGIKAPSLQKIRDSHHTLARILAQGARPGEASIITGYSPSRISILQADPAFQELLEFYRSHEDIPTGSVTEKMALVRMDALHAVHEGILDGEIRGLDALDVVKAMSDRTGFGPATKSTVDVTVSMAEGIARGRERAAKVIEHAPLAQPSPVGLSPPGPPSDPQGERPEPVAQQAPVSSLKAAS